MSRRSASDPRRLRGSIAGPGGPHERGSVVLDSRNAVLLDAVNVAAVDEVGALAMLLSGHGCDRLEYQYRVLTPDRAQPWIGSSWHTDHPDWGDPGDDPAAWWVSDRALTAVRVIP